MASMRKAISSVKKRKMNATEFRRVQINIKKVKMNHPKR
jgi:hypothetical protein